MIDRLDESGRHLTGDELRRILAALANPHRLRILGTLASGSVHVSGLAREIGLVRGAWEELRGEDWEPEPEALARMERQESRGRKALAATGWILGFIAVVAVVSVVLIVAGG